MRSVSRRIIPALFLILLLAGCGYQNPNLRAGQSGTQVKVHVPLWANPTTEVRLATDLRNALMDWLGQGRQFVLVDNGAAADYILNGKINSISYSGRSYDARYKAQALGASLNVDYTVLDNKSGKAVWEVKGFTLSETYSLQSEAHKRQALATLLDNLAEQIYIRLQGTIARHERGRLQQ